MIYNSLLVLHYCLCKDSNGMLTISISKTILVREHYISNLCHLSLLLKSFILCEYFILYFLIIASRISHTALVQCAPFNITHSRADIIIQHIQKVYLHPRAPHPVIIICMYITLREHANNYFSMLLSLSSYSISA